MSTPRPTPLFPLPTAHSPLPLLLAIAVLLASTFASAQAPTTDDELAELEEQAVKAAVSTVAPSVVRIETLGGLEKVGQVLVGTGPTTGLIVSNDGYILSSAFNFVQQPASILVTLPSGKRVAAQIVSRDHSRMLVLLKVKSDETLPIPTPVPREEMVPGQWSIAVGRTFESPEPNVSAGILSATSRIWSKAVQTDAKISPSNYGGPLVDIRGRVYGVLVPLSPQAQGEKPELAGAELYDSGIGFAVPLVDILPRLERMKQGHDLHAGLLGVSLQGSNVISDPAVLAHVQIKSPAAAVGIKAGDKIVEFAGQPVERQAQLRHALGRFYAGERISLVVMRGTERLERELELAEKVDPYQHPFVGLLPVRGPGAPGVGIRFVYPDSPAAKAGLKVGDRVVGLGETPIEDATALRNGVAAVDPGTKIVLKVQRDTETVPLEVTTTTLPVTIPTSLPPSRPSVEAAGEKPAVGVVPIKIPEEPNECVAYVPENYHPAVPHGLIVTFHNPNGFDQTKLVERWKALCESEGLIVLAPKSSDPKRWQPTEVAFVRKAIDEALNRYTIDRTRVVLHGFQAGGSMAYLVAFGNRDVARAIVAIDAGPPQRSQPPENDPIQRLAVYSVIVDKARSTPAIEGAMKRLGELKFPVTSKKLTESRDLNEAELGELARWIEALDRI